MVPWLFVQSVIKLHHTTIHRCLHGSIVDRLLNRTYFNSLYPKILCVMLGRIWLSGIEENFQKVSGRYIAEICRFGVKLYPIHQLFKCCQYVNTFSICCYHLPLEKWKVFLLKETKSPKPKVILWLKSARWPWRRSIQFMFTMKLLSPFHKGHGPSFEQSVKSSPRNDLYQVLWNLTQWLWRS